MFNVGNRVNRLIAFRHIETEVRTENDADDDDDADEKSGRSSGPKFSVDFRRSLEAKIFPTRYKQLASSTK